MPIKFRCIHCRQLLGIAHSKSGQVVDCPTCGRSVRVPQEDGAAQAAPLPEWSLRDRVSRNALDALASIGDLQDESQDSESRSVPSAPDWPPQTPGMPQSIPLDPLPAADPVTLNAPADYFEIDRDESPSAVSAPAAVAERPRIAAENLASEPEPLPVASAPRTPPPAPRNRWLTLVVGLVFLCAGFGAGLLVGRKGFLSGSVETAEGASTTDAAVVSKHELHGRVMYQTENGDVRAERGARVLVFPAERKGTARLPAAAFRPGDDGADLAIAAASLQAAGGVVASIREDGTYAVALPGPGHYQIVMLSRFQPHEIDWTPDTPLRSLLEKYFERPDELLGRTACYFTTLRAGETGAVIADHLFPWPL